MDRRDEDIRRRSEAEEKFEEVVKPSTEPTEIGSGAGGGSTGPGVSGITGTGAVNSTGTDVGTTSSGATGTGMLDTGTGVTGAGSAENLGGAGRGGGGAMIGGSGAGLSGAGAGTDSGSAGLGGGGAGWGSNSVETSGLGAESGTAGGGRGLGPGGDAGSPARDVGEGEINLSAGSTEGIPMRSGGGAAGMDPTNPGIGGHGVHSGPPSRLGSGTGALGGVGPVGTSSLGREHMRDPLQSGAGNPMNELTPDDRGGGLGMAGSGTGTPESLDLGERDTPQEDGQE